MEYTQKRKNHEFYSWTSNNDIGYNAGGYDNTEGGVMSLNKELALDRPIEDVRHEVVLNIVRTATILSLKGAALFRRYDLTEAQFNVLFALKYKRNKWTQSDLGRRLVVTRASITSVLDKLEEKGLVQRIEVPDNRRIYHVELTEPGLALVNVVEPVYRSDIHALLTEWDDAQCQALIHSLERIRERIN
jgi:MarR family 2-MHQ and catechol resistance regulon transcriptional repressor